MCADNNENFFKNKNPDIFDKLVEKEIQKRKMQKTFVIVFSVVVALLIVFCGLFFLAKEVFTGISGGGFLNFGKRTTADNVLKRQVNILLLGVDSNGDGSDKFEGTRSDTIIILSMFPKKRSLNVLSIPRDSKVEIPGHGIQKINASHALGGVSLTEKTIERTFGIPINGYIEINTEAVVELVDALGGVPVFVEKDMHYRDYSGKLNINLTKGEHVLSGKEAECFLRFRKDALGDIGRTSRQQWFLTALAKKLKSPETVMKIPELAKIADKYVKTNLNVYDLSKLAAFAASINASDIETATLPGEPNKKGYASYWILDPEKCEEVINRMVFNRVPKNYEGKTPKAGIIEVKGTNAELIQEQLKQMGFEINCTSTISGAHPQILGQSPLITSDFVRNLKSEIPELKNYRFVYDLSKNYCPSSDFTIIVGE